MSLQPPRQQCGFLFIDFLLILLQSPGFLVGIKPESVVDFEYPNGKEWQRMFAEGLFERDPE